MATQLGATSTSAERPKSRIEESSEEVKQATSRLQDLTNQLNSMADCIDGGIAETDAPDQPRECRAGQVGALQDNCDRLHRRINALTEQVNRLQSGLGV